MNKTSTNLFLNIFFPVLLGFTGCKNGSTEKSQAVTIEEESFAVAQSEEEAAATEESLAENDTITNQTKKDITLDVYLDKLNSNRKLQGVRLDFYSGFLNGKEKYNFEYVDNWFSIDVNDYGTTYTGVYELSQNDTLLHYVSIVPEIYMDGSFVNYEVRPWFEYYYKNNRLSQIKHHDPKDEKTSVLSEKLDKNEMLTIGDSIKKLIDSYLYLDSSSISFDGFWSYPENSSSYVFNVQLKQIGSFVYGYYCSFTPNRYDCGGDDEEDYKYCYVGGYIYSDTLHLDFFSCFARESGFAKLYFSSDTLNWHTKSLVKNSLVPGKTYLNLK